MLIGVLSVDLGALILQLEPSLPFFSPNLQFGCVCVSTCDCVQSLGQHDGEEKGYDARRGQPSDILMKMCRGLIDRLLLLAAFGITVQGTCHDFSFLFQLPLGHGYPFSTLASVGFPLGSDSQRMSVLDKQPVQHRSLQQYCCNIATFQHY